MIEIKITIDTALALLLERMKIELKLRQKSKIIGEGLVLDNLSYKQLMPIVEASIFDTIFLLPIELVTKETNLTYIINGTVKALSKVFHREEFALYTNRQAANLIEPIRQFLLKQVEQNNYEKN